VKVDQDANTVLMATVDGVEHYRPRVGVHLADLTGEGCLLAEPWTESKVSNRQSNSCDMGGLSEKLEVGVGEGSLPMLEELR
jgi:hypothetical protein